MAMRNLILALLLAAQHATSDTVPCYDMNGDLANPDLVATPCNPYAKGTTGSHSACCSITNKDACLSTGLCLGPWSNSPNSVLWVAWCTDSTWQDPACPRFCLNKKFIRMGGSNLNGCSATKWCCGGGWTSGECCNENFSLPDSGIGTVVRQLGPQATFSESTTVATSTSTSTSTSETGSQAPGCSAATSTSSSISNTAIVGGILGAALAASLVLLTVLALSNRKLRRRLKVSQGTPGTDKTVPLSPATMVGASTAAIPPWGYEMAPHRPQPSGSSQPTELDGN
ncbi:hypothetical protein B0J13DRAFT_609540 [Dactylonectria estremocensis]|uniref:Mid2 domain-containing protein n=1 Tax=Dactylonectria estremocensis TaxID=1079267 RepID=A0A9P9IVW6_9HYPO|nr:hypothetical protein B0J13DRAFT_609540 [Dactylonectria estremocensis]